MSRYPLSRLHLAPLVRPRKVPNLASLQLKRVLIVKMSSIGDIVHALPVACALRQRYPSLRISWAVEDWAAPLLIGHPAIDRVVCFPAMKWPRRRRQWLQSCQEAIRRLQAESYDVAIDLQGLLKSSVVVLLSRARARIGAQRQREGAWLVSRAVPASAPRAHVVHEYLACAEFLGACAQPVSFQLPVQSEAAASAARLLSQGGIGADTPLIVINPSVSTARKAWPATRWVQVAKALAKTGSVVLVGAPEHVRRQPESARLTGCQALDLRGRTSLAELVALLQRCSLHIAADTGSAHIAAALGRPVVGIYGPTPVWRVAPYGQTELVASHQGLCGVGCPSFCLRGRRCLRAVTADEVIQRAQRAFSHAAGGPLAQD